MVCMLKKIGRSTIKICLKCTHPQAFQDVDEFVSSSEQILSVKGLRSESNQIYSWNKIEKDL